MWRTKRFMLIALIATVVLAGSIGGIALAQNDEDEEEEEQVETIFDKVADVLIRDDVNITSDQLKDAFTEVKENMRTEAMDKFMDKLVEEEILTQDEADEYLEWWQAKPDISFEPGFKGRFEFGDMQGRFRFGGMPGMHKMHGFGGWCTPDKSEE